MTLAKRVVDGIVFYQFPRLASVPGLLHAVSTRIAGVSAKPAHSLNLAENVGDVVELVRENRLRLSNALRVDPSSWVNAGQVHHLNLAVVDAVHRGVPTPVGGTVFPETDALVIARDPHHPLTLAVYSADCPLVIVVHREGLALGLAHAGWRTTVGGIVAKTVSTMCERFRLDPADFLAGVSPSIGPDCYRVGVEVFDAARALPTRCDRFMKELPRAAADSRPEYLFDLWSANVAQLVASGLSAENVYVSGVCNHCHTDEFFSYRLEGATTGRHVLTAGLR